MHVLAIIAQQVIALDAAYRDFKFKICAKKDRQPAPPPLFGHCSVLQLSVILAESARVGAQCSVAGVDCTSAHTAQHAGALSRHS